MNTKDKKDCMDAVGILDDVEGPLDAALDILNTRVIQSRRKFKGLPDRFKKRMERVQNKILDALTDDEVLQEDIECYIMNQHRMEPAE